MKQVSAAAMPTDPLTDQIANSLRGVRDLREELASLSVRIKELERENVLLESQSAAYRAKWEAEKVERDYYQRFSIEIATSLNLIGQICNDVMAKAQDAVRENGLARHETGMEKAPSQREPVLQSEMTQAHQSGRPREPDRVEDPIRTYAPKVAAPARTRTPSQSEDIPQFLRGGPNRFGEKTS
jgi:hypothetical protein